MENLYYSFISRKHDRTPQLTAEPGFPRGHQFKSMRGRPQEVAFAHRGAGGRGASCPQAQEGWPSSLGRTLCSFPSCAQGPDPYQLTSHLSQASKAVTWRPQTWTKQEKRWGTEVRWPQLEECRGCSEFQILIKMQKKKKKSTWNVLIFFKQATTTK